MGSQVTDGLEIPEPFEKQSQKTSLCLEKGSNSLGWNLPQTNYPSLKQI